MSSAKGKQDEPGICPLRTPGRGSGTSPKKRANPRASMVWLCGLSICLRT
ncbi:Uncharacterised protein [Vibrio cholerae]|nr:Uncharacterised protein [Vibrio cholerae]